MASEGVTAGSRLSQMQMRFQKKQMEEREQRRNEMTGSIGGATIAGVAQKKIANGRVRQMFDERRRGVGIDRSHPLKPITSTTTVSSTLAATTRTSKSMSTLNATTTSTTSVRRQPGPPVAAKRVVNTVRRSTLARSDAVKGSRDLNFNNDELDSSAIAKKFSSMHVSEHRLNGNGNGDGNDVDERNNNKSYTNSREQSSNSIKLNPVVTKKSPNVNVTRQPMRPSATSGSGGGGGGDSSPSQGSAGSQSSVNRTQRSLGATAEKPVALSTTVKTPPRNSRDKMSNVMNDRQSAPGVGMSACRFCGRHFNAERLVKHEHICQKMMTTKRKVYDASKHRVKGTEAEKYLKKPNVRSTPRQTMTYSSAASVMGTGANSGPKKNNWRKKHEEFIEAIRAAKQVQAHLARGGKLSDLPPPPPSENPDYIQCPHCMRRFNQAAAERHIPKCATMQHNKPKPGSVSSIRKR